MGDIYKLITLRPEVSGERIDKYISAESDLTRNSAAILIKDGNCIVNGRSVNKNYKLRIGDLVELNIPLPKDIDLIPENIPLDIVFEDDDMIVVNKPQGMVVHPAHGHFSGTLVNALLYHCKDSLSGINGELRPGIVHRIDMNTSGLLMVAKNDFAHVRLASQIKEHNIKREYEAIVSGNLRQDGKIENPIGRDPKDRKKMAVTEKNSKTAVTHYHVIENFKNAAYLKVSLETGRTHQIRVHMAYIGHPVLGDNVYGSGKPKSLDGQCLHAKTIGFVHPRSGEYLEFSNELPDYFKNLLDDLRKPF
ncbi:MAG: RluA family pseudouridine synthase [Eubacterium sp.]|jgi:23S rRNA pseudouridine1911/1915/1917 synthase|nr:RluA family pseudouridine synthase [Eubacterium sp.]